MSKWLHKKTGNIVEFTDEVFIEQVIRPQGHYEEITDDGQSEPRSTSDGIETSTEGRRRVKGKPKRNTQRAEQIQRNSGWGYVSGECYNSIFLASHAIY